MSSDAFEEARGGALAAADTIGKRRWRQPPSALNLVHRLSLCVAAAMAGCSESSKESGGGDDAAYVFAAIVSSGDDSNTYVSLLDELAGQTVDNAAGREFPGTSDVWVFDGAVFVADQESKTIAKFKIDRGSLLEDGRISFSDYGLNDFGFWVNRFVDSHKAYLGNAPAEFIIWDPSEMTITGTLPLPDLPTQGVLAPNPGYADRAAVLRDGLLYQPVYYADDTYFKYASNSSILVVDTARDEVVDVLDAPCPGLDFGTQLENGDIYFSTWVFAPAGAAVDGGPKTCVVRLPQAQPRKVELAFQVRELTAGREGGAFRYIGNGRALMSVLHDDRAADEGVTDLTGVGLGPYWRFWLVNMKDESAELFDEIDWNGGAAYTASANGSEYMLVPSGDYSSTTVYDLSASDLPHVLETQGWALRLFGLEPPAPHSD